MKTKTKSTNKNEIKLKEQLSRALADYDNLQKRTERQSQEFFKVAAQRFIIKLTPAIDNLTQTQEHIKDQGVQAALDELDKILAEEGIEKENPAPGDIFNQDLHEAVDSVKGKIHGKIHEVRKVGWKFSDGTVIRPAQVVVTKTKG